VACWSSEANTSLSCASTPGRTKGAIEEWKESWLDGDLLTPNPTEESIAAAVSSILIVIEVVSTAALRARGNRGAQPRHYLVLLQRLFDHLAILRRASGR
jgi:hypothetical protein